jgi:U4/U6.U5 tri-snRNP-associated protein 2
LQGSKRLKKTYSIQSLPQYIIFHVKRFTRNNFFVEKNPTIVNFPVKNLELRDYIKFDSSVASPEELNNLSISELRRRLDKQKVSSKVWLATSGSV